MWPATLRQAHTLIELGVIIAVLLSSASCSSLSPGGASPQASPVSLRHDILKRTFTQAAHELSWYEFSIPAGASAAKVSGTLTVSGGSADILVVITDEENLNKFKNGMPYTAFYDSGKVTTATLNFTLEPGAYYLIVSNRHSLLDPKTVNANIYAEY